jgi:hypothetical protein
MREFESLQEFISALCVEKDNSLTYEKLLERAYDIRKFEIELYWKRATYFWGFLIATFTAYFIVYDRTKFDSNYRLVILCLGCIFSLSWYLVNRGSWYWQANWERIIDAIEEHLNIPFYKSNLVYKSKPFPIDWLKWYPYSLSQINIAISLFIWFIWVAMTLLFFYEIRIPKNADWSVDKIKLALVSITLLFSFFLLFFSYTRKDNNSTFTLKERGTSYKQPEIKPQPKSDANVPNT